MDRVDVGDLGCSDDAGDVEVAVLGRARPDAYGAVGQAQVGRVGVGLGVDADRLDPEFLARADDAEGDLASVGNEDASEHGSSRHKA